MPDKFIELAQAAKSAQVDAAGLADALRRHLRGEVRFDAGSRALYATDGSNYRQVPIGIVIPRDVQDVIAAVSIAREFEAPVLCRGGGTSLARQCCNVALVLDTSKYMNRILEIDPAKRIARVQPGVVLDRLRSAAEKHHLTFGPDPATHDRCTLGGMIGNTTGCGWELALPRVRNSSASCSNPADVARSTPGSWPWRQLMATRFGTAIRIFPGESLATT